VALAVAGEVAKAANELRDLVVKRKSDGECSLLAARRSSRSAAVRALRDRRSSCSALADAWRRVPRATQKQRPLRAD
jgi:hypothetical protein